MHDRTFTFMGGEVGAWDVTDMATIVGESLPSVPHVEFLRGVESASDSRSWVLRGVTSNQRYVTRAEQEELVAIQPTLGRAESTRAALIPIRKTDEWWRLSQDERRQIFEEQSRHIVTGMRYLPAIARQLHHCRDLGEPFDFLTWFEYEPEHQAAFDELVHALRATEEWTYVDREIDIRLTRGSARS
jgi:chlorite dismutase